MEPLAHRWTVENYYITDGKILTVEITIPLMEFIYVTVDDVKDAWLSVLQSIMNEIPGFDISWSMVPQDTMALVTIKIAKAGTLKEFTEEEIEGALTAVDAIFDEKTRKKKSKRKR